MTKIPVSASDSINLAHFKNEQELISSFTWDKKQGLIDKLAELAKQSILDSPDERLYYQDYFVNFIYQQKFDALFGGIIVQQENPTNPKLFYSKPLEANILICELLLDADQYFYTGELAYTGLQTINYFKQLLKSSSSGLIEKEQLFEATQLNSMFSELELKQQLSEPEYQLFLALTCEKLPSEKSSHYFLFSQNTPLKLAAKAIDMPLKQAQILEYSMRSKLKVLRAQKTIDCSNEIDIENVIKTNCRLLVLLCKAYLYTGDSSFAELASQLQNSIFQQLKHQGLNRQIATTLIFSALSYLQVKFDSSSLTRLNGYLDKFRMLDVKDKSEKFNETWSDEMQFQIDAISAVLEKLMDAELIEQKYANLFKGSETYHWKVVLLSHKAIDLDSQLVEQQSKFNPYRFILVI